MIKRTTLTALTLAAALLAGCGDDSGGGGADEKEIAAVVGKLSSDKQPGAVCRTLFTQRLVMAIWQTQAECERKNDDSDDRGTTKVDDTQVDGDQATTQATAKIEGRTIQGEIELARQQGDWRIDEFGTDFVRSLLREALQQGYIESAEEDNVKGVRELLAKGEVGRCLDLDFGALPEGRQREIGYAAFGERSGSPEQKQITDVLIGCLSKVPSGRAALRLAFEQGIREDDDLPDAARECVVRRLRETASAELIARETSKRIAGGSAIGPELRALAQQAVAACRTQTS